MSSFTSDEISPVELTAREHGIFQKCARFLLLNSPKDLLDLQQVLVSIVSNILDNPADTKFRFIKLSNKLVQTKIAQRKGGFEFLNGLGFEVITKDGDKVLFLGNEVDLLGAGAGAGAEKAPQDPAAAEMLSAVTRHHLSQAVQWLNENVQICLEYSRIQQTTSSSAAYSAALSTRPCAECIIQIKLPLSAGMSVAGGFGRTEKLSDVVRFARCFFIEDRSDSLLLRRAQDASVIDTSLDVSLIEAGLFPRAMLLATTQSDEDRTGALKTAQRAVAVEIKQQSAQSERVRREKMAQSDARKREKEKTLLAFKEDHNKER